MSNPITITKISYNGPSRIQYSGIYSSSVTFMNIPNGMYTIDYPIDKYSVDKDETQHSIDNTGESVLLSKAGEKL